ncbi:MAG: N-6 DNA methylase [Scytolyngbya sp. HA4215-MV1]|nr:N-6 DNA methylase [Scytolyngbya sp. HA4215-MV1]
MAQNLVVKTRPLRRLTRAELKNYLEKAANILRGNVDHSEFRGYVFALLFYKRISDVYLEEVRFLTAKLGDPELARDPRMHNFVVPDQCLWEDPDDASKSVARKASGQLGAALNEAMTAIELANQPKFDGILQTIDFQDRSRLPQAKLVSLVNHFGTQPLGRHDVSDDLFGDAYEYLIRDFASKAGKSSGEFYTPREVGSLLSEMIEPQQGHEVCDWASGSGSLLLQCRRYVQKHRGDPNQLFLFAQESNLTTYNISRINLILHGVRSWQPRHGDSLREPLHVDEQDQIKQFDRIVMNPPFSLEDWGYNDFQSEDTKEFSDPYGRMGFGTPPRDNGDYAWLQHVAKSLKPNGKAIIVMSQGVLFRGQPEQTEEEDGQNQKADVEYLIREGFIRQDLIECVIVLPSKLFYGNSVPGCLIVLNKSKSAERKDKILMIWASRHFQKANPQNLLRPSDLMRILVPWRAFGDLPQAQQLVGEQEYQLVTELEEDRTKRLQEIEDAYNPVLQPLPALREEKVVLEVDYKTWAENPITEHPYFGTLVPLLAEIAQLEQEIPKLTKDAKKNQQENLKLKKAEHREALKEIREQIRQQLKRVKESIKDLEKLGVDKQKEIDEVNNHYDREVAQVQEAAADLLRICNDPEEAKRYFTVVERPEIEENEFNLNLPRYVDTFVPEEQITVQNSLTNLDTARKARQEAEEKLQQLLKGIGYGC